MNRLHTGFALLLLSLVSAEAAAQKIYTCKDASGRTLTSDRPIPECSARPMRELTSQGHLIREIEAPLTPDQILARDAAAKKQKEDEEAAREQKRKDEALLTAYANEAALQAARHRALADAEDSARDANLRLSELYKDQRSIRDEVDALKGKPPSPKLEKRLEDNAEAIEGEQRTISERRAAMDRVNARFDADLARFRALNAAGRH